jgi:hypothetical protein
VPQRILLVSTLGDDDDDDDDVLLRACPWLLSPAFFSNSDEE